MLLQTCFWAKTTRITFFVWIRMMLWLKQLPLVEVWSECGAAAGWWSLCWGCGTGGRGCSGRGCTSCLRVFNQGRPPTYLPTYLGNLCCHHRADYHSRTPQGRGSDRLQTQEKDAWFGWRYSRPTNCTSEFQFLRSTLESFDMFWLEHISLSSSFMHGWWGELAYEPEKLAVGLVHQSSCLVRRSGNTTWSAGL